MYIDYVETGNKTVNFRGGLFPNRQPSAPVKPTALSGRSPPLPKLIITKKGSMRQIPQDCFGGRNDLPRIKAPVAEHRRPRIRHISKILRQKTGTTRPAQPVQASGTDDIILTLIRRQQPVYSLLDLGGFTSHRARSNLLLFGSLT